MRTLLYGKVTQAHLDDAELLMGITPTSYVTNGKTVPPASNLTAEVIPVCPMVGGEAGILQQHWRLCLHVDAAILVGAPEHLMHCVKTYDLPHYEVAR